MTDKDGKPAGGDNHHCILIPSEIKSTLKDDEVSSWQQILTGPDGKTYSVIRQNKILI